MQLVLIVIGGFVGLWLAEASDEMLGIGLGAGIAYLLGQINALKSKLNGLER